MELPDFLENVPEEIIKQLTLDQARLFRVVPYALKSSPPRLIVAVRQNISDRCKEDIKGNLRNVSGRIIFIGEEVLREVLEEALDKYYP